MLLGLSSAAAPDAGLGELIEIAARRGFAAVELSEGDGHGVSVDSEESRLAAVLRHAATAGVSISGYRALTPGHDAALARLSRTLGSPVVLDGQEDLAGRVRRAGAIMAGGGDVAVVLRGRTAAGDAALVASAGLSLAWEADPHVGALGATVESLLGGHTGGLRHIRLLGGGPEASLQDGAGVGEMMRHLAVAGYAGTLVLAPSTARYGVAWRRWLGRRAGWGCGGRREELPLVRLACSTSEGEEG